MKLDNHHNQTFFLATEQSEKVVRKEKADFPWYINSFQWLECLLLPGNHTAIAGAYTSNRSLN